MHRAGYLCYGYGGQNMVKTKVDHSEQPELDFLHTSASNVECWAFTHLKTLANDLKSH